MKDKVTLTKAELADLMFEKVGLNKREAKDMVETFFEEIRIALERGEMREALGVRQFPAARRSRSAPAAIPRPAKRFPSRRAAWSPSTQARS